MPHEVRQSPVYESERQNAAKIWENVISDECARYTACHSGNSESPATQLAVDPANPAYPFGHPPKA
jgi:hypothetical protein